MPFIPGKDLSINKKVKTVETKPLTKGFVPSRDLSINKEITKQDVDNNIKTLQTKASNVNLNDTTKPISPIIKPLSTNVQKTIAQGNLNRSVEKYASMYDEIISNPLGTKPHIEPTKTSVLFGQGEEKRLQSNLPPSVEGKEPMSVEELFYGQAFKQMFGTYDIKSGYVDNKQNLVNIDLNDPSNKEMYMMALKQGDQVKKELYDTLFDPNKTTEEISEGITKLTAPIKEGFLEEKNKLENYLEKSKINQNLLKQTLGRYKDCVGEGCKDNSVKIQEYEDTLDRIFKYDKTIHFLERKKEDLNNRIISLDQKASIPYIINNTEAKVIREAPEKFLAQNNNDILFKASKLGYESSALTNPELKSALNSMFTKKGTLGFYNNGQTLEEYLKDNSIGDSRYKSARAESELRNFYDINVVDFQEKTLSGLETLKALTEGNKKMYTKYAKELSKYKQESIAEFKAKGQQIDPKSLQEIDNQIQKYNTLANQQDKVKEKINQIELENFKDFKNFKETTEQYERKAKEFSVQFDIIQPVIKPTVGGMVGVVNAVNNYALIGANTTGILSKDEQVLKTYAQFKDDANNIDMYVPKAIKDVQAFTIVRGKDGSIKWSKSINPRAAFREGISSFIESAMLAAAGAEIGAATGIEALLSKSQLGLVRYFADKVGRLPAGQLLMHDEIFKQNFESYLSGDLDSLNAALTKTEREKLIETGTEMWWTPEYDLFKSLSKQPIKDFVLKQFLRQSLGKSMISPVMKSTVETLFSSLVKVPMEESIEELVGNVANTPFDKSVERNNLKFKADDRLTYEETLSTIMNTTLAMLPTMGMGGYRGLSHTAKSGLANFTSEIYQNPEQYLLLARQYLNTVDDKTLLKLFPEAKNRKEVVDKVEDYYSDVKMTRKDSLPYTPYLLNPKEEDEFYNLTHQLFKLSQVSTPSEETFDRINQLNEERDVLKKKALTFRDEFQADPTKALSKHLPEFFALLDTESINIPVLEGVIKKLDEYKKQFEFTNEMFSSEKNPDRKLYTNDIKRIDELKSKLQERITNINTEAQAIDNIEPVPEDKIQIKNKLYNKGEVLHVYNFVKSKEKAKVFETKDVTILEQLPNGKLKILEDNIEKEVPANYFDNKRFTPESSLKKYRELNHPEGFVYDHKNTIFTFPVDVKGKETVVKGRLVYRPKDGKGFVMFRYKEDGKLKDQQVLLSDLESYQNNNKNSRLKKLKDLVKDNTPKQTKINSSLVSEKVLTSDEDILLDLGIEQEETTTDQVDNTIETKEADIERRRQELEKQIEKAEKAKAKELQPLIEEKERLENEIAEIEKDTKGSETSTQEIEDAKKEIVNLRNEDGSIPDNKISLFNKLNKKIRFLQKSFKNQIVALVDSFSQLNNLSDKDIRVLNRFVETTDFTFEEIIQELEKRNSTTYKRPSELEYFEDNSTRVDKLNENQEAVDESINERSKLSAEELGIDLDKVYYANELDAFVQKHGSKQTKFIWNLIKNVAEKLKIPTKFLLEGKGNNIAKEHQGEYSNGQVANRASLLTSPDVAARTIVHELVHGVTSYIIDAVKYNKTEVLNKLTPKQINAAKKLSNLLRELQSDSNTKDFYGSKNEHEILAELTHDGFTDALKNKELNFVERFFDYILDILGISTNAYDEALGILKNMIENPIDYVAEGFVSEGVYYSKSENTKLDQLKQQLAEVNKKISEVENRYNNQISNFKNQIQSLLSKEQPTSTTQETPIIEITESSEETDDPTKDIKRIESEDDKLGIEQLFITTTSGHTIGQTGKESLKDNPQVTRLQTFLNNVEDIRQYELLALTEDNASNYGLSGIIFPSKESKDIKLVVVKKLGNGQIKFIGVDGKYLKDINPDTVIYTSMRLPKLTWNNGEENYHENSNSTEKTPENFQNEHIARRNNIIETIKKGKKKNITFPILYVTRGRPVEDAKKSFPITQSLDIKEPNTQIVIFPEKNKEGNFVIVHNKQEKSFPKGRPFVKVGTHLEFLENRRISPEDIDVVMAVLTKIGENKKLSLSQDKEEKIETSKENKKLFDFLSKILYIRNPEYTDKNGETVKQETPLGNNQIFFKTSPSFSIQIPKTSLLPLNTKGLPKIKNELNNRMIFHNIDSNGMMNEFIEYYLEKGKLLERKWATYQDYLISDILPNGNKRSNDEIPLKIKLNPSSETTPNKFGRMMVFKDDTKYAYVDTESFESANEDIPFSSEDGSYQLTNKDLIVNYTIKTVGEEKTVTIDKTFNSKLSNEVIKELIKSNIIELGVFAKESYSFKKIEPIVEKEPVVSEEKVEETNSNNIGFNESDISTTSENIKDFKLVDSEETDYEVEDIEKAEEYLDNVLPQIPLQSVEGLIDNVAWGQLKDKAILLSTLAKRGTIQHEAYEALQKHFLSPKRIERLREEFRNRKGSFIDYQTKKSVKYSEATDFQIKEELADEYMRYHLSKGKLKWDGEYYKNSWFKQLYNIILDLFLGNIESTFKNLSSGKYRKLRLKYNLNSLTKENKLADIELTNPLFYNDSMKSITALLFQFITDKGDSLGNLLKSDINIDNYYDEVRAFFEHIMSSPEERRNFFKEPGKYYTAVHNATLEETNEKFHDVQTSMLYILDNWDYFVKANKKYLGKYKIEFEDEELEENNPNKENKDKNDQFVNTLTINRKLNANLKIKLLVATLKDQYYSPVTRRVITRPNSLFLPTLVDYNKTFVQLMYALAPATNYTEMMDMLYDLTKVDAKFLPLINKLKLDEEVVDKATVELRNDFFIAFSNFKNTYYKLIVNEDGSSVNFVINEKDGINKLKNEWYEKLKSNKKVSVSQGHYVFNLGKPIPTLKTLDQYAQFAKDELGIDIRLKYTKYTSTEEDEILKLLSSIVNYTLSEKEGNIDNIITDSREFKGKFDKLAQLYNKYNPIYETTQHKNIEGEMVQNITLPSYITSINKIFNSISTKGELIDRLPHYAQTMLHSELFSPSGTKKGNITVGVTEGIEERQSDNTDASNKLSLSGRLALDFANGINNIYSIIVPADTKNEWVITYLKSVLSSASDKIYYLPVFINYFKAEVAKAQRESNLKQNTNQLGLFKEILSEKTLANIDLSEGIETILLKNKEDIEKDLLTFFKERAKETENRLWINNLIVPIEGKKDEYRILLTPEGKEEKTVDGFYNKFKDISKEQIASIVYEEEVKYMINIFEQFNLFFLNVNEWKDPFKRIKQTTSGSQKVVYSAQYFNDYHNKNSNVAFIEEDDTLGQESTESVELFPGDLGYVNHQEEFNVQVYIDPIVVSEEYEALKEILGEEEAKPYSELKEPDAQALAFLGGYSQIKRRANSWTEADEAFKQYDDALCRSDMDLYPKAKKDKKRADALRALDKKIIAKGNPFFTIQAINKVREEQGLNPLPLPNMNILKPAYNGLKSDGTFEQHKYSVAPLIWSHIRYIDEATGEVKFSNAKDFYIKHYTNQTTYITFESANKVGQTKDTEELYKPNGTPNLNIKHKVLSWEWFGIQVETITQKMSTTLGTQLTKLGILNLMSNGVPKDFRKTNSHLSEEDLKTEWDSLSEEEKRTASNHYNLVRKNFEILAAMETKAINQFYKDFGGEVTIDPNTNRKVLTFNNYKKFEEKIQQELVNRDKPLNVKSLIRTNDQGQFILPFDTIISGTDTVENIINSIINKAILTPKIFGGQFPQIASTLFERNPRKKDSKTKKLYSGELKFYKNEDGKRICQVKLPWRYKELLGLENFDFSKIDKELLKGIGFRIPTQALNSVEHFEIVGFLDPSYGDAVMVPSEIVGKAGSDFDIDKLNLYLYNHKFNKQTGKLEKINFLNNTNSTVEERYKKLQKAQTFYEFLNSKEGYNYFKASLDTDSTKLISDIFGEDLSDSRIDLTKSYDENLEIAKQNSEEEKKSIPTFEEFKKLSIYEQNSKKALDNYYIDNLREIVQLEENFKQLVKPNSADPLENEANKIKELKERNQKKKAYHTSILSRLHNIVKRYSFLVGKEGVGIAASNQTVNAISQTIVSNIPVEFPFLFNTNVPVNDANTIYSLSQELNSKGERISDLISMFLDAFVDIANKPYIFDANGNLTTAGTYIAGVRLGIPLSTLVRFFNQPIIIDYVNLLIQNQGALVRLNKRNPKSKKEIQEQLIVKYKLPTDKEGRMITLDRENYTDQELEEFILSDKNPDFAINQATLLVQFRQLEQVAQDILTLSQGVNVDTTLDRSFDSTRVKLSKLKDALESSLGKTMFELYKTTHIGNLYEIKNTILKSFSELYLSENPVIRPFLNKLMNSVLQSKKSIDDIEKELKNIRKDLVTYLLHTLPITYGPLVDQTISSYYPTLFLNKDTNIANTIRQAQETYKGSSMFLSNIIGVNPVYLNKDDKHFQSRLLRKPEDSNESNQMTADLYNLSKKATTENLAKSIIIGAIAQNGVTNTPNSYNTLIPADAIENIMAQVLTQFREKLSPELQQQYIEDFVNNYYQSKWYDNKLVPIYQAPVYENRTKNIYRQQKVTKGDLEATVNIIQIASSKEITQKPYIKVKKQAINPKTGKYYTKVEKDAMVKRKDFSFNEIVLYKRLEVPNPITQEKDVPLVATKDNKGFLVTYFPVRKYGNRETSEYYNSNTDYKPSYINNESVQTLRPNMNENLLKNMKDTMPIYWDSELKSRYSFKSQDFLVSLQNMLDKLNNQQELPFTQNQPSQLQESNIVSEEENNQNVNTEVNTPVVIGLNESQRFTRESAEKDTDYMYLFTDNAGRTSGSGTIDPNSWYAKKYGADKKYASKTQAVARGLENVYPITTMVDDKRTQWTDAQFDEYKKIIDDEIETIKQASKNYKGIKFGAEMPFGKGAISNMKDSAPKIWNYLNTKLAEIGIDNTGYAPKVIISTEINNSKVKVISKDYGVVQVETNPTKEKTEEFVNIIKPQIQKQLYKENKGKFANEMFHYGLMWSRTNQKAKPVKIQKFEGTSNNYYNYHELDQNGDNLPDLSVLQPIIDEIQNNLGLDMSNYDSVIGNLYLDGQYVYPHKDTTESVSARNYPVIVYTLGNDAGLGIVDNNEGKMTFANQYDKQWLPKQEKLKGYTNELQTKNGSIYTFGLDGNGRFELTHSTPMNNRKMKDFPPITLPNGKVITKYTITLTFRRAQDLNNNIPKSPKKLQNVSNQFIDNNTILQSKEFQDFAKTELEKNPSNTIEDILEYYKKCKQ